MTWSCHTHPSRRRYWVLDGTDYRIETTGSYTVSAKTGAERGRHHNGGYVPARGRQQLGRFSTLAAAKARVQRDILRASA